MSHMIDYTTLPYYKPASVSFPIGTDQWGNVLHRRLFEGTYGSVTANTRFTIDVASGIRRVYNVIGYIANNDLHADFIVGQPYINSSGQAQIQTGAVFEENGGTLKIHGISTQNITSMGYRLIVDYLP